MRARRRDANTILIEDAFRRMGCVVHPTNDAWDLTVQFAGITMLVEVKDGKKTASQQRLTPAQIKLHETMCIRIVRDLDGVVSAVETLRKWVRFINEGFTGDINAKP